MKTVEVFQYKLDALGVEVLWEEYHRVNVQMLDKIWKVLMVLDLLSVQVGTVAVKEAGKGK